MSLAGDVRRMRRAHRWGGRPPLPASARPWAPAVEAGEFPTDWARSAAGRAARAAVQGGALSPLVRSQVSLSVDGAERLAVLGSRPVVYVANHASHLDTAAFITALDPARRSRLAVAAAADYFFDAWWRAAGTALAFGTVPLERHSGVRTTTPAALLGEGWSLLFFPSGTRSDDGGLGEWKIGAARLATLTGAPLVPVAIRGSYLAMPRGRSWPVRGRSPVNVRFGTPVVPDPEEDLGALTARLRGQVAMLLAEGAGDWWSSLRPQAVGPIGEPARWRRVWAATEPPPRRESAWH